MTQPLTIPPLRYRLRAAIAQLRAPAPAAPSSAVSTAIGTELNAARRHGDTITVRTRGGHTLPAATPTTVAARYTVLTTSSNGRVILPLRFIESVQRHTRTASEGPA
ncbi:hypothetical protein [Nocardia rhizosphaerihabitans]|uniref:Uncharacterized protein n=1 Tax=Nocardia rhizosphaerihabitans TaxID=1691570 RepID=A0ABQ2KBP2_9NOCA|nr:hypothetical protein [Nocardia rhizosphaerihabitans]GGN78440.1 hypothetical protein GCM10011610_25940 [Nocardia rhizosphaerihabitans]